MRGLKWLAFLVVAAILPTGAARAADGASKLRACKADTVGVVVNLEFVEADPQTGKIRVDGQRRILRVGGNNQLWKPEVHIVDDPDGANPVDCSGRWLSSRGDVLTAKALCGSVALKPTIAFTEEHRVPQIERDFKLLLEVIGELQAAPQLCFPPEVHTLDERTGTVTVEYTAPASDGKDVTIAEVVLVTGPREILGISANIPITTAEQVKFDAESDQFVTRETPQKFMLGLDFWSKDLAMDVPHRFGVKLLFEASKRPTNSFGAALAYRGKLLGLDMFSPFAGAIATRSDEEVDGEVKRDSKVEVDWMVGLSFNLDRALEWLRAPKKSK